MNPCGPKEKCIADKSERVEQISETTNKTALKGHESIIYLLLQAQRIYYL